MLRRFLRRCIDRLILQALHVTKNIKEIIIRRIPKLLYSPARVKPRAAAMASPDAIGVPSPAPLRLPQEVLIICLCRDLWTQIRRIHPAAGLNEC